MDIINVSNEEQSLNIESIVITFFVSNLLKFKFLRDAQPENMFFILLTFLVSKFSIFKLDNKEHPKNIPSKFVTCVV